MKLKRDNIIKSITWLIVILAYSILIHKLATYNNYAQLVSDFSYISPTRWIYLSMAILLMPINLTIETLKWRYAISTVEQISIKQAFKATLIGQVGAFITPNRLGDFPTRTLILKKENRLNGTILGLISSWGQSIAILTIGTLCASIYSSKHISPFSDTYIYITTSICILLILTFCLLPYISRHILTNKFKPKTQSLITELSKLNNIYIAKITILSTVRYLVYCTQLWLFLNFCNINLNAINALLTIPTIYLLSTLTPTITPSVAATNSTYAILIISCFSNNAPAIALATTLTWFLNCCIPLLIGISVFNKKLP